MTTVEILKEMAFTATETQRRALEDAISALSAEPCDDCISRKDAIQALKADGLEGLCRSLGVYPWNVIKMLPSIQPTVTVSENPNKCGDLINRQMAIDAFERFIHELGIKDEPYNYGEMALSAQNVPSAENKGDLISREFLQTAIHNFFNGLNHTPTEEDIQRYIEVAPSVENKGEWIKIKSGDKDFPESIVCSKCKNENSHLDFNEHGEPIGKVFVTSKFCPNCGADMRGET